MTTKGPSKLLDFMTDVSSRSSAGAVVGSSQGGADPDGEIEGKRKWRLPREIEQEALQFCR